MNRPALGVKAKRALIQRSFYYLFSWVNGEVINLFLIQ